MNLIDSTLIHNTATVVGQRGGINSSATWSGWRSRRSTPTHLAEQLLRDSITLLLLTT